MTTPTNQHQQILSQVFASLQRGFDKADEAEKVEYATLLWKAKQEIEAQLQTVKELFRTRAIEMKPKGGQAVFTGTDGNLCKVDIHDGRYRLLEGMATGDAKAALGEEVFDRFFKKKVSHSVDTDEINRLYQQKQLSEEDSAAMAGLMGLVEKYQPTPAVSFVGPKGLTSR